MQGVGTFVAEAKVHTALLEVHNIADEIAARGHRHHSKILQLKARPASEQEATALGIQPGQQVFYSQIVHYENDVPVQLEDRCVNPQAVPDYMQQNFDQMTPYIHLTQSAPLTAGEHIVEAVVPTPLERELLQMEEHEPGLLIHRRTWSDKTAVTSARLLYPGNRYQLFGRFTSPI
jgi:GntR family histidine utilization transcriptional repressor